MRLYVVLFLLLSASLLSQSEDLKTQPAAAFKAKPWYGDMLMQLKSNNKIDSIDAYQIKVVSSDRRTAGSSCASLIKKEGKLSESDIHAIAYDRRNDTLYYIITRSGVYSHLYVYDRIKKNLKSVYNTRAAIITGENIMVLNAVAPKLLIFAVKRPGDPQDLHQFYLYHEQKGSFTHFKTCKRVKGKVECENVKL